MSRHLILYDGVCALCNGLNAFLIPRDHQDVFRFAALQSTTAQEILRRNGRRTDDLDTFYVFPDYERPGGPLLEKSEAGLFVLNHLGGLWRGTALLRVIPGSLRDAAYDFVAKHRYRWFGRYDACLAPSPEIQQKFLED